jgi:hypothetical protein
MKNNRSLIACCGLYCGACSFKVAYDEKNRAHVLSMPARYNKYKEMPLQHCPGCKLDDQPSSCEIRDCVKNKGLDHCGACREFPCDKITKFNNDGVSHHSEVLVNLKQIKEIGEERWLELQEQKWHCECGTKISWYVKTCLKCGKPTKTNY